MPQILQTKQAQKKSLHFLIPFNLISGLVPDCIDKKLSLILAVDVSMMNKIQTQWKQCSSANTVIEWCSGDKELNTQMFAAR